MLGCGQLQSARALQMQVCLYLVAVATDVSSGAGLRSDTRTAVCRVCQASHSQDPL